MNRKHQREIRRPLTIPEPFIRTLTMGPRRWPSARTAAVSVVQAAFVALRQDHSVILSEMHFSAPLRLCGNMILTPYGSALYAIYADGSTLHDAPKTRRVSRCPSTALDPIRTYSYVKNL